MASNHSRLPHRLAWRGAWIAALLAPLTLALVVAAEAWLTPPSSALLTPTLGLVALLAMVLFSQYGLVAATWAGVFGALLGVVVARTRLNATASSGLGMGIGLLTVLTAFSAYVVVVYRPQTTSPETMWRFFSEGYLVAKWAQEVSRPATQMSFGWAAAMASAQGGFLGHALWRRRETVLRAAAKRSQYTGSHA